MGIWNKTKRLFHVIHVRQLVRCMSTRLVEVGKLEVPKTQGKYEAGQFFLHKVFGYRGVILHPWAARLYDRNLNVKSKDPLFVDGIPPSNSDSSDNKDIDNNNSGVNELPFDNVTYYQVLIDKRDYSHTRVDPNAVQFLGRDQDATLYAIPGLDYVNHEDVLPYVSSNDQIIQHEKFEEFFTTDLKHDLTKVPQLTTSKSLHVWQKENHKWLEMSEVHRETTEGIRVTVIPFYMGVRGDKQDEFFWWRRCVRIENLTKETVQLRKCHWRIYSLSGTLDTIRNVVGHELILSQHQPAFQYSTCFPLQSHSAHMWGTYRLEREDGSMFEIRIPPFSLEANDE